MIFLLGDCLEQLNKLPDNSIDMVLTDPPYGTSKCKWDSVIELEPMWKQLKRISKERTPIVFTGTQPFTSTLINSNLKMFRYEWIWNKVTAIGHLVAKKRPMAQHENIVVFSKKPHNYYPQMVDKPPSKINKAKEYKRSELIGGVRKKEYTKVYTQWYPKTIITISNASKKGNLHPTQKPIELMEYLIKTYTKENNVVLDFAMGSGTTGVACRNLGRKFIGIEKDEYYFKIACERIKSA